MNAALGMFPAHIVNGPPTVDVEDYSYEEVRQFGWACTRCGTTGSAPTERGARDAGWRHIGSTHIDREAS